MFPGLSPWRTTHTARKLLATTCGLQFLLLLSKYVTEELHISGKEAPSMYVPHMYVCIYIENIYCVCMYVYEKGQLLLNYSAYEEHFVLQVCIVSSMNYWSQRDTADHYTHLFLYLDQRATCNCKPNLCLPNRTLPEKLWALGTFWVESTTFLCHLLVPALTLSHHYKCTSSFQLPDFSPQPSAPCYTCFCEPFSLQRALPQKMGRAIIKSPHLSIKKQQIQQQIELFRLSLWYLNTTQPSDISSDSFLNSLLFSTGCSPPQNHRQFTLFCLLPLLLTHPNLHTSAALQEGSHVQLFTHCTPK